MKHSVVAFLLINTIVFTVGIGIAYYNTRTMGFDEDATVFSKNEDGIMFLDFTIEYETIKSIYRDTEKYIPKEFYVAGSTLLL